MNSYKDEKNIISKLRTSKTVCIVLGILVLFLFSYPASAGLIEDKIKELQEINQKTQEYQQKVDEKKEEINTLSAQIENMDNQLDQTRAEIEQTKLQIEKNELEIENVSNQITLKEKEIEIKKELLLECVLIMYEQDQTSTLEIIASGGTFSDFLAQMEYIESIEGQTQDALDEIEILKKELNDQKTQLEDKERELTLLKEEKELKEKSLAIQLGAKEDLLVQTQGEEGQYQQMLVSAQSQRSSIQSVINNLQPPDGTPGEGGRGRNYGNLVVYNSNWYHFYQHDSRWAYTTIGSSNSLMKDWGCAVTCIAMVAKSRGVNTDPGQLAKSLSFAYGDLIYWGSANVVGLGLVYNGGPNWARIDSELSQGRPVIVCVTLGPGIYHYVTITGRNGSQYIVDDPYFYNMSYGQNEVIQMIIYH